jgi:hypothetical protein
MFHFFSLQMSVLSLGLSPSYSFRMNRIQLFCVGDLDFFNWNRVFVRYCDGASFSGNSSLPADEKVVALFTTFDSSGCICRIEELFILAHDQACFLSLS